MIDRATLLADLRRQVTALEPSLTERAATDEPTHDRLYAEWQAARGKQRLAATFETWRSERVTQVAVAWVLGTVFLRFCEDNGLTELPYLAGPGDRLELAQERQTEFIRADPLTTDRDWIVAGFRQLEADSPVAAGLFDQAHNPLWQIELPHHAAKELLGFWRRRGDDGQIVHDFTDPELDTRFLGDLYQDLSDAAKKHYALLQTPEFVEEFILDLTFEPAVTEFGLAGLRTIDPTCGSGHFLLGLFHRLLDRWRAAEPGTDRWTLIRRSLESVHGVDKNPFAVAVARFRLLVAALKAADETRLTKAPDFPILVAIGDSLLHGRDAPSIRRHQQELELYPEPVHTYATEDISEFANSVDMLGRDSYHVVVGNPPYITVKDKQENENYRRGYESCAGTYALSVPFAERFFKLAKHGGGERRGAGFVGQITSNSFMKREFGKKLIEQFFLQEGELTYVIDSSGAYIPGHGTPTVILVGRHQMPRSTLNVRAVLGVQGEPSQPGNPAKGHVWTAIVDQIGAAGSESEWVTVTDLERASFARYPWSLAGGGSAELFVKIDESRQRLAAWLHVVGRTTHTGLDEAFYAATYGFVTRALEGRFVPVVLGEDVRDYRLECSISTFFPYDANGRRVDLDSGCTRFVWPNRTVLRRRVDFGETPEARGLRWFDHSMFFPNRYRTPLSIAFAFVGTHNHFVLDRGGKVFNRTAPVVKLPEGATEDEHLALLGVLNSSTACFWLKQVSYPKGGDPVGEDGARVSAEGWSDRYEFTGTKLEQFPLPETLPLEFGRALDGLAQELSAVEPAAVCEDGVPTRERLDEARAEHERIRGRMIASQEELDWEVYRRYDLLNDAEAMQLRADPDDVPELRLGERAFEIVLARKVARGELETAWFTRHRSTPITELPAHWPAAYREVVEKRIETIERRRDIALIERPECKRRWASEPWEKKEQAALRDWLLDRCEDRKLWYTPDEFGGDRPEPLTVNQLADRLRRDPNVVSVARLYAGSDADLATILAGLLADEHVPYLAQLRYKASGLAKRAQWEQVWEQQREEDRLSAEKGEDVRLDIPVPPKYTTADFVKTSYWKHRGKLDVPKERFLSYPGANPDTDDSLLLGWAGWDHRDQARALQILIDDRASQDGWEADRLTPLIAGLAEVLPWVRQWHGGIDPAYGQSPAEAFASVLEGAQHRYHLSAQALRNWRPPKATRGPRPKQQVGGA